MAFSIANTALRLVAGAFILNSGIGKLHLPAETQAYLQGSAARVIPAASSVTPAQFGTALSSAEIGLGTLLLTPFVPSRLAGLALGVFATGMVANYLKTPGATGPDGVRPTTEGTGLAKDVWLAGIAVALLFHRKKN